MTANEVQVGGTHYKGGYEHWDLVYNTGMGYFEGQISRYLVRWRKKDGLQDLEKAKHYINKRMELGKYRTPPGAKALAEIARFAVANELTDLETQTLEDIVLWSGPSDLQRAFARIELLIKSKDEAQPVPVSDSNKHAERSGYPCDD